MPVPLLRWRNSKSQRPHPKTPDDPLLRRHCQPFPETVGVPPLPFPCPSGLPPFPSMAKFTHLSRPRRAKPTPRCAPPSPKAEHSHRDISGGLAEQQSASDISDAEYLINRVSGACAAKAAYVTRSEVATYLRQTGYTGTPYACQFCGLWHVTTMSKKAQKLLMRKIRAAQKILDSMTTLQ